MTFNPFVIKLFCLLSLFSFLKDCNTVTPGTWKNEKIAASKRDDFHALNTELLNGLKENKLRFLEGVFSKEMLADTRQLRLIELCSNHMKEGDYSLLDEYYVVNEEKGPKTLESNTNGYSLDYDAETREMYFAFFVPKSLPNQSMITAVYCKYSYGWKLSLLALDQYTMNGKTAPELYKQAQEMYNKKYLLDALNTAELAKVCMAPVQGWKYPENGDINAFCAKANGERNKKYVYPFTLKGVFTQPSIFSITTRTTPEGVFPMVYYKSSIKLQDTAALRKENDNIKRVIGQAIPGIDKDKKYVFYDAYNEWPRYDRSVDRYDMPDKLK